MDANVDVVNTKQNVYNDTLNTSVSQKKVVGLDDNNTKKHIITGYRLWTWR